MNYSNVNSAFFRTRFKFDVIDPVSFGSLKNKEDFLAGAFYLVTSASLLPLLSVDVFCY